MSTIPDSSNFFASLNTALNHIELAKLFEKQGWAIYEPDDCFHVEVMCEWGELIIESCSPVLLHGPVAEVLTNADHILSVLRNAKIPFSAECLDEDDNILQTWP